MREREVNCMSEENFELAELTDQDRSRELLQEIENHILPPVIDDLIRDYHQFESARPQFMWKWVHKLAPENTLPCVDSTYTEKVPIDKTIAILFITLLDDLLEKEQDNTTFQVASHIPFEREKSPITETFHEEYNRDYVAFTQRVWDLLIERIQRSPDYDTYSELFRYDVKLANNAIEYSNFVTHHPELATTQELERYESHNMMMFAYADIDLMHTRNGVGDDFAKLREAIWHAQLMARIGNWLSTWERELTEGDYSAGIVVYALENGIISSDELKALDSDKRNVEEFIDRVHAKNVEEIFIERWYEQYSKLREIDSELHELDLTRFIKGTKEVFRYHLASKGLK